jgi:hypothetical protein
MRSNIEKLINPIFLFTNSEKLAISKHFSNEKYVLCTSFQLQLPQYYRYNYEYHQLTMKYLFKRHELLRVYHNVEKNFIERINDEEYVSKVVPLIYSEKVPTYEELDKILNENFNVDQDCSFGRLGFCNILVKTPDGIISFSKTNHFRGNLRSGFILNLDALKIFNKISNLNGRISYEEAVEDLPIVPKYSDYLIELHTEIENKKASLNNFYKIMMKNYASEITTKPILGNKFQSNRNIIEIKNLQTNKFIEVNSLKPHQIVKFIYQYWISKMKVFFSILNWHVKS